jgi:hypothetical protein
MKVPKKYPSLKLFPHHNDIGTFNIPDFFFGGQGGEQPLTDDRHCHEEYKEKPGMMVNG